jgi:mannobiose 2-epimerase
MMSVKNELSRYRDIFENELHNILAYWMTHAVEKDGNGFYAAVDLDNKPVFSARKTSVLNARILWTFAAAAKKYPRRGYGEIADRAYRVVTRNFADHVHGGYFMELSSADEVVNESKHTYAQAFVLYALCKYYEFHPAEEVMELIREFFHFLDGKAKDPDHKGYLESFSRDWQLQEENRMADGNEPKTMNTHLHLLEAYAAVCKVWKGDLIKQRLTVILRIFIDDIIRENGHLGIFFTDDFQEAESSGGICSFGHDIEASWLLWEAAGILGDPGILKEIKPKCLKMADAVLREGVDKDGGLFLESTRFGSHVRTNKHWWLQAENLVGFMNMYELKGDRIYWETVKLCWDFIDRCVIDHKGGEWFTKVDRLGRPYLIEPADDPSPYYKNNWKVDPWKCPYHNGRAMMELVERIDRLMG